MLVSLIREGFIQEAAELLSLDWAERLWLRRWWRAPWRRAAELWRCAADLLHVQGQDTQSAEPLQH